MTRVYRAGMPQDRRGDAGSDVGALPRAPVFMRAYARPPRPARLG